MKNKYLSSLLALTMVTATPNISIFANETDHIIINQIYGGGGKGDTPFSHSFIELYNPTNNEINLDGYKITYSSSRENSNLGSTVQDGETKTIELTLSNVKVPINTSYLIRGAEETTSVSLFNITKFDANWDRVIDNNNYTLKLLDNGGVVVDAVSVKEENIEGPATTSISKQKSIRRKNFLDTNNNLNDFEVIDFKDKTQEFFNYYRPRSLTDGLWTNGTTLPDGTPSDKPSTTDDILPNNVPQSQNKLKHIGNYSTGFSNKDGGVAEIVKYNKDNGKMYIVNGQLQSIDIVDISTLSANGKTELLLEKRIDIATIGNQNNFSCGDITSIDINTKRQIIAITVQHENYLENGYIVVADYDGNYIEHFEAGNQPDMIVFTPDGNYVLSANEGEPREGYTKNEVLDPTLDPKGSVTIINLEDKTTKTADFTKFDSEREKLIDNKVILKKDSLPSVDLEPEYIAIEDNSKIAYVSLQEANAIATLDIEKGDFTSVKGLGFKDYNQEKNALDAIKDGRINIETQNLYGVYMPDGLATINIGGTQYVLTPNEGDAREWGKKPDSYANITSYTFPGTTYKIDSLINSEHDGLEADKVYTLGARSFSIWNANTMELVYDSGSDFEKITATKFPEYFNISNDKIEKDARSSKKGPEPEDVKTLKVLDKVYAFIGLERIGGIMMYDITNPSNATFCDYINTRDFSGLFNGDSGPEGLCTIEAKDSPTGYPIVLVANEVSGTVSVMQINEGYKPNNLEESIQSANLVLKSENATITELVQTISNLSEAIIKCKK